MKRNVIILTGGLAGSSVLAALLAQDGYWTGTDTIKKRDYDTWENRRLVELNQGLLDRIGFTADWTMRFRPDYIDTVTRQAAGLDPAPFQSFARECAGHAPWLWKDPRLWLTMRHWAPLMDLADTCFLVIRRDPLQSWISTTLRRQIQTMRHARAYESGIHASIIAFLDEGGLPYLDLLYEDLLTRPEAMIASINQLAGTRLALDDLRRVFRGRLYRRQHGPANFIKALAIYLKNHGQRYR